MNKQGIILLLCMLYAINCKIEFGYNKLFVDENNRTRIFHGVNIIVKPSPFHPTTDGFNFLDSLVDEDFQNLQKWGLNIARFYIPWQGLEKTKGDFDYDLLDKIKAFVEKGAEYGVYFVLDAHQDLLSPKYCGEGAPDWAVTDSTDSFTQFPKPFQSTIDRDANGYPKLSECLKNVFIDYYYTYDLSKAFQDLYDNVNESADHFAAMWEKVALRFKGQENVLGYDLINEPWYGDFFKNPDISTYNDKLNLEPFYKKINTAIRKQDKEKILFFEPTLHNLHLTFTGSIGGPEYKNKEALSYHVYCDTHVIDKETKERCLAINKQIISTYLSYSEQYGVGAFLSEFGAVSEDPLQISTIDDLLVEAESKFQSWAYWQFKHYGDFTTIGDSTESFYSKDGLEQGKLKAMSRSYFYAICGTPVLNKFDTYTGHYEFQFIYNKCLNDVHSELYLNEELFYNHGFVTDILPSNSIILSKIKTNYYRLTVPDTFQGQKITVKIRPIANNEIEE